MKKSRFSEDLESRRIRNEVLELSALHRVFQFQRS